MKKSSFGKTSLVIGMAALLTSCGQKEKGGEEQEEAVVSTAELAREARFSPWTSKAGLWLQMENLPEDQYFSTVEGRLKDGENQYRAIAETFDQNTYSEWSVIWGFSEEELFLHEIKLLRAGFNRYHSQVFTDSAGVALHQLTMLRRVGDVGSPVSPLASANRAPDIVIPPIVEVEEDSAPEFMRPELRRIDDPIFSAPEPEVEAVTVEERAASVAEIVEESVTSDVLAMTSDQVEANTTLETTGEPSAPEVEKEPKSELAIEKPEPPQPEQKPEPKPEPKPLSQPVSYRVVKGDTLSSIARRHKVTVSSIKKANGLRSDVIRLRQVLKIPKS